MGLFPTCLLLSITSGCVDGLRVDVVHDFFVALNAHDVDRVLALLDEGYVFRDADGTFEVPRDHLRPMFEWDAATRARSRWEVLRVRGDTVVVRVRESNAFLDALGVSPWNHEVELVVRDGVVAATIVDDAAALGARVDRALEPVLAWARRTRPARLEGLVTESGLVYTGETARRWMALLREARAAGVIGAGGVETP